MLSIRNLIEASDKSGPENIFDLPCAARQSEFDRHTTTGPGQRRDVIVFVRGELHVRNSSKRRMRLFLTFFDRVRSSFTTSSVIFPFLDRFQNAERTEHYILQSFPLPPPAHGWLARRVMTTWSCWTYPHILIFSADHEHFCLHNILGLVPRGFLRTPAHRHRLSSENVVKPRYSRHVAPIGATLGMADQISRSLRFLVLVWVMSKLFLDRVQDLIFGKKFESPKVFFDTSANGFLTRIYFRICIRYATVRTRTKNSRNWLLK